MIKVFLISFVIVLTVSVSAYEIFLYVCRKNDWIGMDEEEDEENDLKEE